MNSQPSPHHPAFRPAVVAPTFNNARTLRDILDRAGKLGCAIVAVNDGSTDKTAAILADWQAEAVDRFVLTHGRNRGKAAALRSGFALCRQHGFTHAVSIDTDGQLSPEDIPRLLQAAAHQPDALVLGTRDERCADYPLRSRWGRRISNFFVRLECGQRVEDSQCGLRVYPLPKLRDTACVAEHYGFETEVITRAAWDGVAVCGVPVACRYLPPEERVSQFKPWRDSIRAAGMHGRLLAHSLSPAPRLAVLRRDIHSPLLLVQRVRRYIHQSVRGLNPLAAWRSLKSGEVGSNDFAAGFSLGVFIANLPLYGFQTVIALFGARRLRLHPLAVLAGTQASIPPLGPLLIAAAVVVGHLCLHGSIPALPTLHQSFDAHMARTIGSMLLDWIVGSLCVGACLATGAYLLVRLLLNAAFGKTQKRRATVHRWSPPEQTIPVGAQHLPGGAE